MIDHNWAHSAALAIVQFDNAARVADSARDLDTVVNIARAYCDLRSTDTRSFHSVEEISPFPMEPGFYWFYGWPWGQDQDKPARWVSVQVRAVNMGKSRVHVAMGAFWYESEGHVGKWFRAVMPEVE